MKPIRVMLVEDHVLVRSGIRALLEKLDWVRIVAEASNGREGLALVKTHRPDVVLVDISMPGMNGLEMTSRVRKAYPTVRVLVLSVHRNEEYVVHALWAGASGYLVKDATVGELEIALKAVARGQTYLSPAVSKFVVADYIRRVGEQPRTLSGLTPRQREVLQLIAEGLTTKEIASELNVAVKTADCFRTQLMQQLDIHNIAGLVRYAIRTGAVSTDA